MSKITKQVPRTKTFKQAQLKLKAHPNPRRFDYSLEYKELNLRLKPELYRVGVGEQGVLLVEPYKSEILPYWRFKTPLDAETSSNKILELFNTYRETGDFIGMDMSRKFLQMGYTRSRRYANHSSGRKYDSEGNILPYDNNEEKAESAEIFHVAWKKAESDETYHKLKIQWKTNYG